MSYKNVTFCNIVCVASSKLILSQIVHCYELNVTCSFKHILFKESLSYTDKQI